MEIIIKSLMIALVAFVYSDVLTEPNMVLNGLYKELETRLNPNLFKPLIGCYRCVAGQMAMWLFPFLYEYSVTLHIFFICLTIYLTTILCKIYRYKA